MKKLFFTLAVLSALTVFLTFPSHAATYAYIKKTKVYVKNGANSQAKNIAALKRGTKVAYRKTQGNWYLISFKSSSGKVRSGWVAKGSLSKQRPTLAQAKPRYSAPPKRPPSSSRYTAPPRSNSPSSQASSSRYKKKKPSYSRSTNDDSNILLQVGLGGSYYTYNVSSDLQSFKYSFLGPSAQINIAYKAWEKEDLSIKVMLDGNFALYSSNTNLQDTNGTVFSKRTQNNMAFHIVPGVQIEKNLSKTASAGFFLGYRYYSFMGDDIVDVNSDPLGLYNSYTATGIVVGPSVSFQAKPEVTVTLALNAILAQGYQEDPQDTSGQVDAQSLGLMPRLDVMYKTKLGNVSFRYSLHRIESSFVGNVNRVEQSFTNITAKTNTHFVGVLYNKSF